MAVKASASITLTRVNDGQKGDKGDTGAPGIDFSQGKMLYDDPMFAVGANSTTRYANSGGDYLTWVRSAKSADNPMTGTDYEMVCTNTGAVSPANGGFYFANTSKANARFVYRIIAKIPTGRSIMWATNVTGTGTSSKWRTSNAGTGTFTEYIYELICGNTGTFSTTGFFYVNGAAGTTAAPLKWYVAYATCFDMTNVSLDTEVKTNVTEIYESISSQNESLSDAFNLAIQEATKDLLETGDYEAYKETVEAAQKKLQDSIDENFMNNQNAIGEVANEVEGISKDLEQYFDFDPSKGLTIRTGPNQMELLLQNDKISFSKNGVPFGWWDGVDFHTGNIVVEVNERAQFGNFAYVPRSDGSLMFLKVGG